MIAGLVVFRRPRPAQGTEGHQGKTTSRCRAKLKDESAQVREAEQDRPGLTNAHGSTQAARSQLRPRARALLLDGGGHGPFLSAGQRPSPLQDAFPTSTSNRRKSPKRESSRAFPTSGPSFTSPARAIIMISESSSRTSRITFPTSAFRTWRFPSPASVRTRICCLIASTSSRPRCRRRKQNEIASSYSRRKPRWPRWRERCWLWPSCRDAKRRPIRPRLPVRQAARRPPAPTPPAGTATNLAAEFVSVFDDSPPPGNKGRDPFNPDSHRSEPGSSQVPRTTVPRGTGGSPVEASKRGGVAGKMAGRHQQPYSDRQGGGNDSRPGRQPSMLKVVEIG